SISYIVPSIYILVVSSLLFFFFFTATATTEIYTLSLHDALPISQSTANILYTIILKLPNMATLLIISLLATFFISKDWYRLVKKIHYLVPEKVHNKIDQVHLSLQKALLGFLKAEFKLTF